MSRAPVTIVILAWNAWDSTRACLESLRPTLGVRDQVVVVDNGSSDGTAVGLRRYPWIEAVSNRENRGFAGGCNDGAAVARHDTIIFLNNDTLLAGRWIDPIVAALADPSVGAVGPRSNFVSGAQVVEGAAYQDLRTMRKFVRQWATDNRGATTEVTRLVGFCLAVPRSLFEAIGRFDEGYGIGGYEDDDLCRRVMEAGRRLLISHESFVHHEGHKTFDANGLDWYAEQESNRDRFASSHPGVKGRGRLVSACLIVKDEEAMLPDCLDSLTGVADETVIYDTGSTDGTVALARARGATVIEGHWDDDFARARNAALEQCSGEWIIWLDADETFVGDPAELRDLLGRTRPEVDAWSVSIHNLTGAGTGSGFVHHAARVFRRERCEWVGRLHEQITMRGDHAGIRQAVLEAASIRHTGYLDKMMVERDKAARNLRVAQAEVDRADGWQKGFSLTSLSRSLMTAGQIQEAYERAEEALDHCRDNAITRRMAMRTSIEALLALGRLDDALAGCERLRSECTAPLQIDPTELQVRLARKEWEPALEILDRIVPGDTDEDGLGYTAAVLAAQRATALSGLGRPGEAADALLGALAEDGTLDTHLGLLVEHLTLAGRSTGEIAAALPADKLPLFLAQVVQLQPDVADRTLDAAVESIADPRAALAAAATVAKRLPIDRALLWSARLRQAGFPDACPLIAQATAAGDPVTRARAATTATAAFADPRGPHAFLAAFTDAGPVEREVIRGEAAQLYPPLAAAVSGAPTMIGSSR